MTAKVEVINQGEIINKQKQDIVTYNLMLKEISDKLHQGDFGDLVDKVLGEEKSVHHAIFKPDCQDFVKIFPFFLVEDSTLSTIQIEVHDKKAFEYIKDILNNYSDCYNHLEKITIRIYF